MSDTPRTDALWDNQPFGRPFLSEVGEFARQLERELAEVTSQRDKLLSTLRTISFSAVDSDIKLLADQALAAVKGWEV